MVLGNFVSVKTFADFALGNGAFCIRQRTVRTRGKGDAVRDGCGASEGIFRTVDRSAVLITGQVIREYF